MKANFFFSIALLLLFTATTNAQNKLRDADNDTRVEVERTADNDLILFRTTGTDAFQMKKNTLEFLNSGKSVFIGRFAGENDDLTNNANVFVGELAGQDNTTGAFNVAFGQATLRDNISGIRNLALGQSAMSANTTGAFNVAIGSGALQFSNGSFNVAVGGQAGSSTLGDFNVFLGHNAGFNETGSNKLYIENSNSASPLIYGDFTTDQVGIAGADLATGYALSVNGKGIFSEVRVLEVADWPDYVFTPSYDLKSLEEVKTYIDDNGHLPNIPSAQVVKEEGIALGEMQKNLLEKVEELTLYMIQTNEQVKFLQEENIQLRKEIESLKKN